jgi:hypothetical protein
MFFWLAIHLGIEDKGEVEAFEESKDPEKMWNILLQNQPQMN